jgi:hypothetical protein
MGVGYMTRYLKDALKDKMPIRWMTADNDLDGDASRCNGCSSAMVREREWKQKNVFSVKSSKNQKETCA